MGYEVTFHYKEEVEKGIYSEEEKSKKIKVGNVEDDTPLEAVAGKIFAQLARRNILVTNVEIYEFTKKKLNYKEIDDGFLIKNKKFRFDDGVGSSVAVDTVEESPENLNKLLDILNANPALVQALRGGGNGQLSGALPPITTPPQSIPPRSLPHERIIKDKPLRNEVYDPPPWLLKEARQRGLKFTIGKQYPILKEKIADVPSAGMIYTTINDAGERQSLAGIHFNPIQVRLEGNFQEGPIEPSRPTSNLSWDGMVDDSSGMPSLR